MAKISAEEKIEAVQRYLKGKESARALAADSGISHRYLLTWVKQYEHNGVDAFVKRYTNYTKQFKIERLPEDRQLLMHSDQGWHYQMKQYRHTLASKGIL